MNLTQLRGVVRNYLNRPDLDNGTINLWVDSVEGELNRRLREHPRNQRRAIYTQPADNEMLPLPADIMQLIVLWQGETIYGQFPAEMRSEAQLYGNAFIARGTCLELFPTPGEDTVFSLDYLASLKPLSLDTDVNWVSQYFTDVYVYGLLREAAVYLKDDARLKAWNEEFNRRVTETAQQGWGQNLSTAPRMRTIFS